MNKDKTTLNFRPDQNTKNADKRETVRQVHTHGSRRADAPGDIGKAPEKKQ